MLKTLKTTNIKGTEAATVNIPMKELLRKNTLYDGEQFRQNDRPF